MYNTWKSLVFLSWLEIGYNRIVFYAENQV